MAPSVAAASGIVKRRESRSTAPAGEGERLRRAAARARFGKPWHAACNSREPTAPRPGYGIRPNRGRSEEAWVGAPPRVLVIEDDPALREMLCEALADEGYQALPSDHPVAPLDVQQLRPSMVVLDLMLGGEPAGYGWLEALRDWPWTARLPVLVCSGYLAPEAPAAQRVRALANVTVPKPFVLDELLAAVAGCVEAAASHRG